MRIFPEAAVGDEAVDAVQQRVWRRRIANMKSKNLNMVVRGAAVDFSLSGDA